MIFLGYRFCYVFLVALSFCALQNVLAIGPGNPLGDYNPVAKKPKCACKR